MKGWWRWAWACAFWAGTAGARAETENVRYVHDDAGRLVLAVHDQNGTNAAAYYQYDPNGNRTGTLHVAAGDTNLDANADGMPDLGELAHFDTLAVDGAGDPDGDTLVNSNELALAGDPHRADTDSDAMPDADEAIAGTALNDSNSVFEVDMIATVPGDNIQVGWGVRAGRTYQFQSSTGRLAAWTTNFVFASTNDGAFATNQPMAEPRAYRAVVRKTE